MNPTFWIVCAVTLVALVVAAILGPRLGWFSFTLFGKAGFSARRASQPRGAFAEDATAGRDLNVRNDAGGTASANRSAASRDINVSNEGR